MRTARRSSADRVRQKSCSASASAPLLQHRFAGHLLEPQRQHRVQGVALLQSARRRSTSDQFFRCWWARSAMRCTWICRPPCLQLRDGLQRALGIARVDQQLGHRHQPGLLALRIGDLLHPLVAPLRLLHAVRRARRSVPPSVPARHAWLPVPRARRGRSGPRTGSRWPRAAPPGRPTCACAHGRQRHGAAFPRGAAPPRTASTARRRPAAAVPAPVQRQLDPVRRVEQHHIALVELREQRRPTAPPNSSATQNRSRMRYSFLSACSAPRLSAMVGSCTVTAPACACLSRVCTPWTRRAWPSK